MLKSFKETEKCFIFEQAKFISSFNYKNRFVNYSIIIKITELDNYINFILLLLYLFKIDFLLVFIFINKIFIKYIEILFKILKFKKIKIFFYIIRLLKMHFYVE